MEGDRVFVGTAGDGLHVLDAGRDHRALAHYPWGQVSEVALASGAALVRAGGVLGRYARRGGELELLETHPVDASAGVAPRADGFLVAGAEGLHHIDATGARETLASEPLRTLITHRRAALALTEAGDLLRWTGGGLEVAALGLEAEALVALHGELLAVGQSGLTVVELRSGELTPLGHLPLGARADEGACLTGGQLLLGRSGGVVSLELPAPSFETVHTSERARGTIAALTASRSGFLAAAGAYGAIRLEPSGPAASPDGPLLGGAVVDPASGWSEAGFPAPYTRAVSDVAESRGRRLALFPDRQEVRAFDEMEPELGAPVLAGAPFTALEGHDTLIAAAAGGQLYLVDPAALPRRRFESPPVASVVPVEDGADVLGLALLGRDVFVTTTTGALYRIRVGALPIVDTRDVRVERVATGLGVARHLAVDGEHAFVAREAELQRVALASGAVEELTLDAPIRGVALDAGSLWAAADRSLWRIDAQAPTWAGAERVRELAHTITA
ncbi:MAG TPA: hypothetical protein RMG95_23200, partial [Polyangiaceae bacterium LLY-WYZ-15_(1-7)]|nr:hypothetical protein [Polyangiaceae bacterium LLY-WYZ-15_(1-7)]